MTSLGAKFALFENRLAKLESEGSLQAMQKLLENAKLEMNGVLQKNGKTAKQRTTEARERDELGRKEMDDYIQKTSVSCWNLVQRADAAMAELQALDGRMTKEVEDLMSRADALTVGLENLPTAGKFQAVANDVESLQKKVAKLQHAGVASPSQRSALPHRPGRGRSSDRSSASTTPQTLGRVEEHASTAGVSTARSLSWRHKVESELERLSDEVSNLAIGVVRENLGDGDESIDREVEIRQRSASLRRRGRSTGAEAMLARNASCPAPSWRVGEPTSVMRLPVPSGMRLQWDPDGRVSFQPVAAAVANFNTQFSDAPLVNFQSH